MNARVRDEAKAVVSEEPSADLDSLLRAPPTRERLTPAAAVCLGHIVAIDTDGTVDVEFPGSGGALRARRALASPAAASDPTLRVGQQVVLTFENGDPSLPIMLGFIQPASAVELAQTDPVERPENVRQVIEADVDGRRVRIVGQDEIVLQCGDASITLRRNGRVLIRGTYVETYSDGTNRIKGGQVRIN